MNFRSGNFRKEGRGQERELPEGGKRARAGTSGRGEEGKSGNLRKRGRGQEREPPEERKRAS
jgi:hypothetical protein